jgi:3-oxoacyl-[acyl-carrier-protein] synthase III
MGSAFPGPPVSTIDLLTRLDKTFGTNLLRRGIAIANCLGILTRHVCRDFEKRYKRPRAVDTNAELAAASINAALAEAGLKLSDLDYIIEHTTTPSCLVPPNVTSWQIY